VGVGTEIVGVGVIVVSGIEIWGLEFEATPKTLLFLTAAVYEGVRNEGMSKESTNKTTVIKPLFFNSIIFIPLIELTIKKSFPFLEKDKSSCSGKEINIVF
jgi:hypothetical protein